VWVHCFLDVSFLAYVVDTASVFDEVSDPTLSSEEITGMTRSVGVEFWMEDNNPMYDSLRVFSELCHLKWFSKTTILLLINKINVLQERMSKKSGIEQVSSSLRSLTLLHSHSSELLFTDSTPSIVETFLSRI
jgi:hypothetical protein